MRNPLTAILNSRNVLRLATLVAVLVILGAAPLLSGAQTQTSVNIVNNSGWELRHLYISPVDNDNWGPDQLHEMVIAPGQSYTLNIACDQAQVKLISEDQDGCFLSTTVACTGNAAWTITNDMVPNCGN
ncbi:MAG TPA: hypothetical protein VGX92_21670 [Pyrinomonadaceae bacterium]|jgi:hypothetical protein|nr:hypothetical protein [Pyrinomonadaceae bacterium]